jgi:hypothetical protein
MTSASISRNVVSRDGAAERFDISIGSDASPGRFHFPNDIIAD